MNTKFEINKTYSYQTDNYYFGDTCGEFKGYIFEEFICIKRTEKFVTFERVKKIQGNIPNVFRCRIIFDENNNERVFIRNKFMESK